jgi:predicted alpha/beta hydrolase
MNYRMPLHDERSDITLSDYRLPTNDDISALELAKDLQPDIPFIFVSGTMGGKVATLVPLEADQQRGECCGSTFVAARWHAYRQQHLCPALKERSKPL